MKLVEKECGCRPWDYPTDFDSSLTHGDENPSRICDYFGNTCFHSIMKTEFGEKECLLEGYPDCNAIKHTFSVEKTPLNADPICQFSNDVKKYQLIVSPKNPYRMPCPLARKIWPLGWSAPHPGKT